MLTKKKEPSIYAKSTNFEERSASVSQQREHVEKMNMVLK
jgi:hypothetical protein